MGTGWIFVCAMLLAAVPVYAQDNAREQQPGVSTIRVNANLVILDVVVTDAQGRIVPGLKKEDFSVLQDGAPQTILNFDSWTARQPAPEHPVLDSFGHPNWGETPLAIFVLDELNTPFDEKSYAADMLKKYFKSQPPELSTPTMLMTVNDYGSHTLQLYTRDRDLLIARLEARPPAIPTKFSNGQSTTLLRKSFALLRQIAIASEGSSEHKNIVWIGRGFPGLDPASLSDKSQASLRAAIKDTVTLLLDARVTVYKVDSMPTTTQLANVDPGASLSISGGSISTSGSLTDFGETPQADNFNFNNFAVSTGGKYFYGLNDLNRFIDESMQAGNEFYTLTYRPPKATVNGAFLNIQLKMLKPGLTATTRQGYYAQVGPRPEPTADELGFDLGQAAVSEMSYDSVGVAVVSVTATKRAGEVSVTLHVEDRSLRWTPAPGGSVSDFIVVFVALDAKHEIIGSRGYKLHPFMAEKDNALLLGGSLTVKDNVVVPTKTRYLRVLVRDSSGRIGTADVEAGQLQRARGK